MRFLIFLSLLFHLLDPVIAPALHELAELLEGDPIPGNRKMNIWMGMRTTTREKTGTKVKTRMRTRKSNKTGMRTRAGTRTRMRTRITMRTSTRKRMGMRRRTRMRTRMRTGMIFYRLLAAILPVWSPT